MRVLWVSSSILPHHVVYTEHKWHFWNLSHWCSGLRNVRILSPVRNKNFTSSPDSSAWYVFKPSLIFKITARTILEWSYLWVSQNRDRQIFNIWVTGFGTFVRNPTTYYITAILIWNDSVFGGLHSALSTHAIYYYTIINYLNPIALLDSIWSLTVRITVQFDWKHLFIS